MPAVDYKFPWMQYVITLHYHGIVLADQITDVQLTSNDEMESAAVRNIVFRSDAFDTKHRAAIASQILKEKTFTIKKTVPYPGTNKPSIELRKIGNKLVPKESMMNRAQALVILCEGADFYCKNCGENLGKATQLGKLVHCSTCGASDQKNPAGSNNDEDEDMYTFVTKTKGFKVGDKVTYYKSGYKEKKTGKITKIDKQGWIFVDDDHGVGLQWQSVSKI